MSSTQVLAGYETQLAEIHEMLKTDPKDESLLKLKSDMEELISLTKADFEENKKNKYRSSNNVSNINTTDCIEALSKEKAREVYGSNTVVVSNSSSSSLSSGSVSHEFSSVEHKQKRKKLKLPTAFIPPPELLPLPTDSEPERKRKRRTLKTLKSKWRERVKEVTSDIKRKSWQDFSSKTNKRKNRDSIFRTEEGVNSRVGIIGSGRSMTEFGERKRFKL